MYSGVSFDAEGNPIAPSRAEADQRFDADGTPYVAAGTTITVEGRVRGLDADGELRVIFAVEEPRRVGFALGTVDGSVVSGEESFMLEWHENDEVWFTVRAFDAPASWLYRLLPTLTRRRRRELFTRYLRAISPLYTTPLLMGAALPLGEPVPPSGALPDGVTIDQDAAVRRVPARAVLPRPVRLLRLQHLHLDRTGGGASAGRVRRNGGRRGPHSRATWSLRPAASARPRPSSSAAALRPCCPPATWPACSMALAAAFGIADGAEVTVEANPDDRARTPWRAELAEPG